MSVPWVTRKYEAAVNCSLSTLNEQYRCIALKNDSSLFLNYKDSLVYEPSMNEQSIFESFDQNQDVTLFNTQDLRSQTLTPLIISCMKKDFTAVKSIIGHLKNELEWTQTELKNYIDLQTTRDKGNVNALLVAIENNDIMTAQYLLAKGAATLVQNCM